MDIALLAISVLQKPSSCRPVAADACCSLNGLQQLGEHGLRRANHAGIGAVGVLQAQHERHLGIHVDAADRLILRVQAGLQRLFGGQVAGGRGALLCLAAPGWWRSRTAIAVA